MKKLRKFILVLCVTFTSMASLNSYAKPKVAVSILPLHDLVAQIGQGVFDPELLLDPKLSPHDAALKPSQIVNVSQADLLVWIGPEMETALAKIVQNLELSEQKSLVLMQNSSLSLLPFRQAQLIDLEAKQAHDNTEGHDHNQGHDHGHGHGHGHDHGAMDPHIWLSISHASQIVTQVTDRLVAIDAENSQQYQKNRDKVLAKMRALNDKLDHELKPIKQTPFLVLHDSQQYFDAEFGLSFAGALVQHSVHELGAKGIQQAKQLIDEEQVKCLFVQPQFVSERGMQNLANNLQVDYAILDQIGASLTTQDNAWFKIIQNMATQMKNCLASSAQK